MKIILASSSPRRCELMKMFNIPFEVTVKPVDERIDDNGNYYQECMNVAYKKAKVIFDEVTDDIIVIGSDTIVLHNNKVYGKPKNLTDAFKMIKTFSGKQHEVISSLCVLVRKNGEVFEEKTYDKALVSVVNMSDSEINDWINNHDVITRAGAYAIQDGFAKYIDKIDGDYFSIVGLPVHKLYEVLKKYI